jgi:hypothetical protein
MDLACNQEGSAMIKQPTDDAPEDYSYDLAHEVPIGPDRHVARSARRQVAGHAPHPVDPDTDYESDEAHDL